MIWPTEVLQLFEEQPMRREIDTLLDGKRSVTDGNSVCTVKWPASVAEDLVKIRS